jgi:hypothetical protein
LKTMTLISSFAIAATLALPSTAGAWTGNTMQSPSGNLICKWRSWTQTLACGSRATRKIVALTPYGRPKQGRLMTFGDESPRTLYYGDTWTSPGRGIACKSMRRGIACVNGTGWSFLIYREAIDVYYHNLYYWSL